MIAALSNQPLSPASVVPYPERLSRYPDARRASVPLAGPFLVAVLSLAFGAGPGALLAIYNAVAIRRWGRAVAAGLLGLVASVSFLLALAALHTAEAPTNVGFLVGRAVHAVFGILLVATQLRPVLGHFRLRGPEIPTLPTALAVMALTFVVPGRFVLGTMSLGALTLLSG